jgi:hypothetical protein
MSQHPQLYHYTRPAAFESIVGAQTLWCSHCHEMLDTDEVRQMRNLLPPAVVPRMDAIVEKLSGCWDEKRYLPGVFFLPAT